MHLKYISYASGHWMCWPQIIPQPRHVSSMALILIWLPVSLSVSVSVSLCLSLCLCPPPPPPPPRYWFYSVPLFVSLYLSLFLAPPPTPTPSMPHCLRAHLYIRLCDYPCVYVISVMDFATSLSKSVCVCVCPSGNNECNGISNQRCIDCLPNRLFRCKSKKTPKLRTTGLCEVTSEFPAQRASNAENFPIWWRHHVCYWFDHVPVSPCFCLCLLASVCCLSLNRNTLVFISLMAVIACNQRSPSSSKSLHQIRLRDTSIIWLPLFNLV